MKISHDDLVRKAVAWLRKPAHYRLADGTVWYRPSCGVVLPEYVSWSGEVPDAFGMTHGGYSCAIECKASRGDFLADKRKSHRAPGMPSIGQDRFYLAPPGVIEPGELPEGWGFLELRTVRIVRVVSPPGPNRNRDITSELGICYSLLRRCHKHGHLADYLSPKWGGRMPDRT